MENRQKEVLWSEAVLNVVEAKFQATKDPRESWAPTDFIPDFSSETWHEDVQELQASAQRISDAHFMSIAGNMITEEGLPCFLTWINQNDHIADRSGVDDHPWAKWARAWTAEENKHGDVLHKYLYLSGRVDMRAVEESIGDFLRNGFTTRTLNNPYRGMVFTSFQERATRISHGRIAEAARAAGDTKLAKLSQVVAADEGRHEAVYQSFVKEILNQDPNQMLDDIMETMKTGIVMPFSATGKESHQFFSKVTEAIGMYTYEDYIEILEFLIKRWEIESLQGLNEQGAAAQEYLCKLPERYRRIQARKKAPKLEDVQEKLMWVKPRKVNPTAVVNNFNDTTATP
jgi:acyl-[acyl-carrier-protein] desaturase